VAEVSADQVSEAIVEWTGYDHANWPTRDDHHLTQVYGPDRAAELLPLVKALAADYYSSNAHLTAPNLTVLGDTATTQFRSNHPEISPEAIRALEWCYTFDLR
jgi:hypothetical protein